MLRLKHTSMHCITSMLSIRNYSNKNNNNPCLFVQLLADAFWNFLHTPRSCSRLVCVTPVFSSMILSCTHEISTNTSSSRCNYYGCIVIHSNAMTRFHWQTADHMSFCLLKWLLTCPWHGYLINCQQINTVEQHCSKPASRSLAFISLLLIKMWMTRRKKHCFWAAWKRNGWKWTII